MKVNIPMTLYSSSELKVKGLSLQEMNMMKYTLGVFGLLFLFACKQEEQLALPVSEPEQRSVVTISGTFDMPELIDLDRQDDLRAFVLRPDEQGYPKIRLTDIERGIAKYEAFPTSVWLYTPGAPGYRIDVEDYGGDPDRQNTSLGGATNKSHGTTADRRGVSRIIERDGKYHVLVSYEVTGRQGQSVSGTDYPNTYPNGTRAFVAFNHYRNDGSDPNLSQSKHRVYMPKLHNVKTDAPVLQLDPLREVQGDYIVSESSHTMTNKMDQTKRFKLPFTSRYADLSEIASNRTAAGTATRFSLCGALLVLKFRNETGRNIIVRKIHTKSNNLAYSGFYELWNTHGDVGGTLPSDVAAKKRQKPFFVRSEGDKGSNKRRNHVYPIEIKDKDGADYTLSAGATSTGAFYLWGGIDETTGSGTTTRLQVEYVDVNAPSTSVRTRTINIAPKVAPHKFEEGKAYLITIPIR